MTTTQILSQATRTDRVPESRTSRRVTTSHDLATVRTVAGALLDAMTSAGPDAPSWATAGPLVGRAALRLREALGVPVVGTSAGRPVIVLERDFAVAARPLQSDDVRVADDRAAADFVLLAVDAALALS